MITELSFRKAMSTLALILNTTFSPAKIIDTPLSSICLSSSVSSWTTVKSIELTWEQSRTRQRGGDADRAQTRDREHSVKACVCVCVCVRVCVCVCVRVSPWRACLYTSLLRCSVTGKFSPLSSSRSSTPWSDTWTHTQTSLTDCCCCILHHLLWSVMIINKIFINIFFFSRGNSITIKFLTIFQV